ncbi:MAG: diadenosine tetraphosphatase [Acidobacteria bacterium]|nr:diadenosine tetraphosphatase [Acidobacteriota bacterium]NIM61631.1 diadenosine tetraphosphatase [Acidobacteriota bacterium]NIO58895.1 diadenosine tetraphosphatase [Acidobacteriota bacterium]NIQ29946.1 diadenosine tetraphosphatase [Acidobacteriota bacterium]NIQ87439.1 diadenosine tetraphosphatase [Acidobacteriota bacterium]
MRWVVGDLQGCAEPLERLLEEIRFDRGRDELWSVGDVVNRGPDSAKALRLWKDVGARGVLGNHDVYALLAASGTWPRKRDTLDDLFSAADRDDLLETLRRLPLLVHLPAPCNGAEDAWLVHAGILPGWSDLERLAAEFNAGTHDDAWLQSESVSAATRVRCCTPEGGLSRETGPPDACVEPYRAWDAYYSGETRIVHGHWARRGHYRGERTIGLDSGCVYGGPLTAWCQDDDRIVQVPGNRDTR